jgi:nucleoid-associated protein YgaU
VGVKIRLPYANPGSGSDPAADPNTGVAVDGRRPTQGLGGTHTVVRGDTLSSISQQYYGSSSRWRFLYEANKATIPNPNQLAVGMELIIPPYEE